MERNWAGVNRSWPGGPVGVSAWAKQGFILARVGKLVKVDWPCRPSMGCDRWVCGRTSFRFVRDAAQNLPLPIGLMDRPAVNGPAAGADHVRFSVFVHVQATFLRGWFEFLANTVGI